MQKKTFIQRLLPTLNKSSDLKALEHKIKVLEDKAEDEMDEQIRVLAKGLDGDYYSTGSKADFTSIEEDITKAQLQKLLLTETWFYIVVNTIAKTIAALPPKIEKRQKSKKQTLDSNGNFVEVEQEEWVDASGEPELKLFKKPNSFQPPVEFYWLLLMDLLGTGDCYIYIDQDDINLGNTNSESRLREVLNNLRKGVPSNLYRLNSALVEVIPSSDGKHIEGYGMQTNAGYYKFQPHEVLHIRIPNPASAFYGIAPIVAAMKNVLIDRYTKEHFIRFYKQGARLGGVIKTKQKLTKEQLTRLERTFESNYTGRQNHHRTLVLPQDMDYQTIEANPGETSLIEFTKANKEPILAVYDVPPVKVGILDGASYANANVQMKIYYTDTIQPILTMIEQAINNCPQIMNPLRKLQFKFDLSGVEALREDQQAQSTIAKGMIDSGLTVNEVRHKVWKLGPLPGGNKSKVIEDIKDPSSGFPFFNRSAKPAEAKAPGDQQPDNLAISDIEPSKGTFEDRVSQLAAEAVNQGVPFQQALEEAIAQALKEGFIPSMINESSDLNKPTEPSAPKPDDDKKKEPEVVPEQLIAGRFSKEQIVEHWKKTAGEGIQQYFDKRDSEVQGFFKRLQRIFLKPIREQKAEKGKDYCVKADDQPDIDDKELDAFIAAESKRASAAMEEAMKLGYSAQELGVAMKWPDTLAKKRLLEISTRNVKSVVGTTKDQLKKVLDDAYSRDASMNEIISDIREKFDEISEGRAITIVRTEVLTAVSAGQQLKVDQFKEEFPEKVKSLKKLWIDSQDEKVRDSHVDYGALEPVDEDYEYAPGLKYPRDVDCKDAGDVINCRCSFIYFMEEDQAEVEEIMANNDLLPNEGNNNLAGEEKGGPGSGRRGHTTAKPQAEHGVSQADNGQITLRKPKTPAEATAQLQEVGRIVDQERSRYQADPSVDNGLRVDHANRQMSRAITNARQIIDQHKPKN